jgi:hypothetical protein
VVICGREICEGGQVFNCYGPHRAREPACHRRATLRAQYMFTCDCAACSDAERRDFVVSGFLTFFSFFCLKDQRNPMAIEMPHV